MTEIMGFHNGTGRWEAQVSWNLELVLCVVLRKGRNRHLDGTGQMFVWPRTALGGVVEFFLRQFPSTFSFHFISIKRTGCVNGRTVGLESCQNAWVRSRWGSPCARPSGGGDRREKRSKARRGGVGRRHLLSLTFVDRSRRSRRPRWVHLHVVVLAAFHNFGPRKGKIRSFLR
ncbi:hypothetical protein SCHPADRAFT_197061 [Schizopora paradoxa]|uniref:Uncharacterized protein n=1 Tax=Schizopora paradoxa TaxID=27342 RepID=A0A0H2SIF9_9AGAM|nr:hypothetical protein SCHPADRAFT_197061 [Schizopora paradoxa]